MVTQQRTKRTRHSVGAMAPCEQEWVDRARAGESLRDRIILSLHGRIERMASRFMQGLLFKRTRLSRGIWFNLPMKRCCAAIRSL